MSARRQEKVRRSQRRTLAAWEAEESARSVTKDREQEEKEQAGPDLSEVKGQQMAKRALEIAVAGGHNLFLDGPPGPGSPCWQPARRESCRRCPERSR